MTTPNEPASESDDQRAAFASRIERLREGDEQAVAELWEKYYSPLVRIAASRLPRNLTRTADEEDIALSAFHSFVAGVRDDRFPDLSGPDNLWGLLITLTTRKVGAHVRKATRIKRGDGSVRGESVFVDPSGQSRGGLEQIGGGGGEQASPEVQVELAEACDALLDSLGDEQLKQIAVMRMEGYLVDEIAEQLAVSKRAVERRLQLIRQIWSERATSDGIADHEDDG